MSLRSVVVGCGAFLPQRVVTNTELAERVDTSDAWISQRTGIRQRYMAGPEELTSDLAIGAARAALDNAGMTPDELDLIILATTTPDNTFPATATKVQAALGMQHGAAFDIQAVCSGFIYGLKTADAFLRSHQAKTALVIGAETMTRLLDWSDRQTCVLFGDGAGAFVLRSEESEAGILSSRIRSDGSAYDLLYTDGGPSTTGTSGYVRMNGKEVFRHAVRNMSEIVGELLAEHSLTARDIKWLVPHQANQRILEAVAARLDVPPERVVSSVERHANTSSASVPLAFCEAVGDGRIKRGDLIVLDAMGAGFTWGASLLRW